MYDEDTLRQFEKEIKNKMVDTYEYCKLGLFFHGIYELNRTVADIGNDETTTFPQTRMEKMTHKLIHCFISLAEAGYPLPTRVFSIIEMAEKAHKDAMEQMIAKYHEENNKIVSKRLKAKELEEEINTLEGDKNKFEAVLEELKRKLNFLNDTR